MKKFKQFKSSVQETDFLPFKKTGPNSKIDDYLIIGFDTEYVSKSINDGDFENELLSYQWCCQVISSDRTKSDEWSGLVLPNGPKVSDRLKIQEFVELAISEGLKKDKKLKIPRDIYLVAHFTRSDIPGFRDFKGEEGKEILNLSNIRNTFVSMRKDVDIKLNDDIEVRLKIRDTITLTSANSKSLDDLGKMLKVPKLKLSKEQISNMKVVLEEEPELFERYGIRDCEICLKYTVLMMYQYQGLTGRFNLPQTLTSIGVDLLEQNWKKRGHELVSMIGKEKTKRKIWNKKLGRFDYTTKTSYKEKLYFSQDFIRESYHGGRNEQFYFGPHKKDVWYDYDLKSCYPSCMSLIGIPQWDEVSHISEDWWKDPDRPFKPIDLTFVQVDFTFPPSVRFPCLPVRTDHGIIFPRKGISLTHISEVLLAKRLGCELKFLDGRHVPQNRDGYESYKDGYRKRTFQSFLIDCIQKRESYPKGSQENFFWKEIANSSYGKLAQGLRERRIYSVEEDDMQNLPTSKITNPVFASFITGFARGVLSEIMNNLPKDKIVFSVTTDGFLTNCSEEELEESAKGQLSRYYKDSRHKLVGDDSILEIKHIIGQPLGWRTRGQSTLVEGKSKKYENIVLAKGGIKLPEKLAKEQEYPVINDYFFNREPDTFIPMTLGLGIKDMYREGVDFVDKKFNKRLSMEFDFKRKPLNYGEMKVGSYEPHLIFDTQPWDDVDQFNKIRFLWEDYNKTERHCLKTISDYDKFAEYVDNILSSETIEQRHLKKVNGDIIRLRRDLISSWRHSQGGTTKIYPHCFGEKTRKGKPVFPTYKLMNEQFARILNDGCGIPCSKGDVDNGIKIKEFTPNQVPNTERTRERLDFIKRCLFPELRVEEFLSKKSDWDIYPSGRI
jgi:hypothetical protein